MGLAAQTVSGKPSSSKALESFCRDLCQQARDKSIDVVSVTRMPAHFSCLLLSDHLTVLLRSERVAGMASHGIMPAFAQPLCMYQLGPLCGR